MEFERETFDAVCDVVWDMAQDLAPFDPLVVATAITSARLLGEEAYLSHLANYPALLEQTVDAVEVPEMVGDSNDVEVAIRTTLLLMTIDTMARIDGVDTKLLTLAMTAANAQANPTRAKEVQRSLAYFDAIRPDDEDDLLIWRDSTWTS